MMKARLSAVIFTCVLTACTETSSMLTDEVIGGQRELQVCSVSAGQYYSQVQRRCVQSVQSSVEENRARLVKTKSGWKVRY